jgi:hypothetical protein
MSGDRYNPINLFEKASKLKLEIQAINKLY